MLAAASNIRLIEPLDYGPFVAAMSAAAFIVTDSGGVQEEGAALGKAIIVLREETERPEAVANGNAVLVGSDKMKIIREMGLLADDLHARARRSAPCVAYGDGSAATRIVDILERAR
jgi:UDP-N-acetylglucosamine 2-epimerase (non-hydrolysing)